MKSPTEIASEICNACKPVKEWLSESETAILKMMIAQAIENTWEDACFYYLDTKRGLPDTLGTDACKISLESKR